MAKTTPITPENRFDRALKYARKAKRLSQEQFDVVSSRTYISVLERNQKSPTLQKVDKLAEVLQVHPLTLLALAYTKPGAPHQLGALLGRVASETAVLQAEHEDAPAIS